MGRTFARWRRALALGFLAAGSALLALAPSAARAAPAAPAADTSRHLVSVAWLQQNLSRGDVLLLDASPGPLHAKAHIPGAVHADLFNFGATEQSPAAMQERFRAWGVSPGRKIVLYDGDGTMWAARMFFELVYLGFPAEDIALLDGGLAQWVASGGAVTQAATPQPPRGTFTAGRPREELLARLPDVLAATGEPQRVAVIDALTPDYHFGGRKLFERGGHLPNAQLLPHTDFFNDDKTFKSPEAIRRMLDHHGLAPGRPAITYCGGGVAGAVPFFAMKVLMGHGDVKLYRGSQLDWQRDERGLPMWTYAAPHLLRDADWLATWGQGFMRQMGLARVQVVDVRPAAAYAQGHLPGAFWLDPAALRAALADAPRLAALLQPMQRGMAAGFETVVVSATGGVNPDAALALALLERAGGQARVSLLTAGVDEWALRGLPLDKGPPPATGGTDAGTAAAPAGPPPGAVPGDAVTIASGAKAPQAAAGTRVIHLPYTQLLAKDGQPKPAGELWAALDKAGVPRHTALRLVGDEPGEAAANYVLLKLMGFRGLTMAALPAPR
jgi:3-mercaptopyruvate sulfurtransferase SseA